MLRKSLSYATIAIAALLILGCGAPSELLVDGVRVEPPDQGMDPQIITLPYPMPAAIDSIKLDLIHRGFTIKESDNRLGIIQTDDKILAEDEDFERKYSTEQKAAGGCLAGAVLAGCIFSAMAIDSDKKGDSRRTDEHRHDDDYASETKSDIIQSKGRLQIIASKSSDSARTTLEITAYLSTYTNGVKGSESQAIRLHPFIQKYACLLEHKNCGRAPGQKVIPPTSPVKQNP